MPDTLVSLDGERYRDELIRKFRDAADTLEKRNSRFAMLDVKFFLLAALNDCDRALNYGNPGRGIDDLLGGSHG